MSAEPIRLALITRHYPPAVSGGVRRAFQFAQELKRLGVVVHVIAPSLPAGERGVAVPHAHRDAATGPLERTTWRSAARELLLWPDPDIRWSMRAARAALTMAPIDWVLTTSPPESIHAGGAWLKRRTGARWIADFRDHWLTRPHRRERQNKWRAAGERRIAQAWLSQADLVVAVDDAIAGELAALGARAPHVIPHAAPAPPRAELLANDTINVVHTGSLALSDPECDIGLLLAPIEMAIQRNPKLRLHLAGRLTEQEIARIAASPAAHAIVLYGTTPADTARALQAGADALIFAASKKMHVPPSKITEYLTTDLPIIACGEGPWRRDARAPASDPVEALAALTKDMRVQDRQRPPTPQAVAKQLLELMQTRSEQR